MASEPRRGGRAFPFGLTVVAAIGLAVLAGLGVWQMRRLTWKEHLIARIEALRTAPAEPVGPLLVAASRGQDVDFRRAEVDCAPPPAKAPPGEPTVEPTVFRYALRDGRIGWRVLAVCRLAEGPFDGLLLDRGLETRLAGAMAPTPVTFDAPARASGVLRRIGRGSVLDPSSPQISGGMIVLRVLDLSALAQVAAAGRLRRPAPWFLAVEHERPAPPGILPAPLPRDIPNNHLAYALTWFALAAILGWFYGAMLWRRLAVR